MCLWVFGEGECGGRDVRMWSGSVCGMVDVVAGECIYGACLMVLVLVRVCRCGLQFVV